MQFTWQDPACAIMGAVHCHSVKNPRSVYFLSPSYLGLSGEEEDSAVGEATGDVLHVEDGKLLLLVGTSCCAEPSLEVPHISPTLAGPACLAWAHQGWEVGLHSFLLPLGLFPEIFSLLPAPEPHHAWTPPPPLLVCAKLDQTCWCWWFGCGKAVGAVGKLGGLQQPRGWEHLPGAWQMPAEHPNQPAAFLPFFLLQSSVSLF